MIKKYQIDIKDIKQTLSQFDNIDNNTAQSLSSLLSISQQSINSDSALVNALNLLETLSELDIKQNAFLALMLDNLIHQIENFQNRQVKSANQILSDLIKKRGVKQKDLTHILPQSIISELVNGKRQLTLKHIIAFADYFNVSVEYFIQKN